MPAKGTRMKNRGNSRNVSRNEKGQFKEIEDVGRSATRDQKRSSKTKAKRGQGGRSDR